MTTETTKAVEVLGTPAISPSLIARCADGTYRSVLISDVRGREAVLGDTLGTGWVERGIELGTIERSLLSDTMVVILNRPMTD